jgi:hypothetical protein
VAQKVQQLNQLIDPPLGTANFEDQILNNCLDSLMPFEI